MYVCNFIGNVIYGVVKRCELLCVNGFKTVFSLSF